MLARVSVREQWTARMHDVEELEKQILEEAARKRAAEGAAG